LTLPIRLASGVAFLVAIALAGGCKGGPKPPKRGKVEGNVTLNGKPVTSGYVRFFALDPNGLNAVATITEGKYSIPESEGLTKGKYRVEFSVPSATKKRVPNDDVPGQFMSSRFDSHPRVQPGRSSAAGLSVDVVTGLHSLFRAALP
jgi:hypothetical protein